MFAGDDGDRAAVRAAEYEDDRLTYLWDPGRITGNLWQSTLGFDAVAWDVYLLYRAGVEWQGDSPPEPDYWMHQLGGVDGPRLDKDVFAGKLDQLVPAPGQ